MEKMIQKDLINELGLIETQPKTIWIGEIQAKNDLQNRTQKWGIGRMFVTKFCFIRIGGHSVDFQHIWRHAVGTDGMQYLWILNKIWQE